MYITVKQLTRKNKLLLHDVSLTVEQGDFINIIGLNGSGKSSFFKMLLGEISFEGSTDILPNDIAIVSDYASVPDETKVSALLKFVCSHTKNSNDTVALINLLNIDAISNTRITSLSSGEKRKLEIFCAITAQKKIIIYDEVTVNLDKPSKEAILSFITKYHSSENAPLAFFATHDLTEVNLLNGKKWFFNSSSHCIEDITGIDDSQLAIKLLNGT